MADGENKDHEVSNSASCEEEKTPKSLTYLDRLCDRRRVECVVHMLATVAADKPLVSQLHCIAHRHRLSRLCRIIDDILAFSVDAVC